MCLRSTITTPPPFIFPYYDARIPGRAGGTWRIPSCFLAAMLSRRGANMGYHIQAPRRSVSTFGFIFFLHLVCSVLADVPHHTDWQSYQDGKLGLQPNQTFHSAPHIGAPIYQVNKFNYEKVDKSPYIFLAGAYSEGLYGPSIISSEDLSLVWADERYSTGRATKPYIFKGQPVIAAYAGDRIRIYNQHYQQLYQVGWQLESPNRQGLNNHECYITEDDTVVIIFDEYTPADLTSLGGPAEGHGVIQQHVQEIDPVTNTVLFHFSTLNHFPVSSSLMPYWDNGGLFHDYSHMNSAQKTPEGDFLISIKHFGCIIMVNGKNAQPKWIMGGARNQFTDITKDGTATFGPQHHARISGKDRITLFDNAQWNNGFCEGRGSKGGHCSRGLELEYDLEAMTVWVVNEWYHPQGLISATRGGVQPLPNGNTLIAWGQNAMYTEHTPDGEVVMDIQRSLVDEDRLGHNTLIAYRAWKGDWEGKPTWGPNISANADASGNMTIYVSWNGATAVKRWVLVCLDML
ncbi:putative arylsulfotransferase-like protein [Ilyonectria robusta]